MVILINTVTVLIALFFIRLLKDESILHPQKIFLLFFILVQVSGYFIIEIIKKIDGRYKIDNITLVSTSLLTLYALIIFLAFYYASNIFYPALFKTIKLPSLNAKAFSQLTKVFLSIGILGLLLYFIHNGFTLLRSGGYSNKNLANVGIGYARIMYGYGFKFALISFLAFNYSHKKFVISIFASIIIGISIFIIIGGGRASAISLLILSILIAVYYDKIKVKKLIFLGIVFTFIIVFLAVIRYRISLTNGSISLLLYYLQGSFSPVDSFGAIYRTVPKYVGYRPSLVINPFLTLIPRVIWPNKPLDINVASAFFTKKILHNPNFLTISTTLLGELYLYHGFMGITIGMFICALLVKGLTILYKKSRRSNNMRIFFLLNILYAFTLFREGIGIALRNLLLFSLMFFLMTFVVNFLAILSKKESR